MAVMKPLIREEVPEEAQNVFDYNVQWQEPVPLVTGRHKNRTMVKAVCPVCSESHDVPVNDVRNWIRGNRKQMPGTHRKCKYTGIYVNGDGYHFRWMPDHPNAMGKKYVAEHIYVMSESLGRPLDTAIESVHHIDGDHGNNELFNLQLRVRYHGKGQAWECNACGSHDVSPVALKE